MSLSEAFNSVLSKPIDFSGRARRSEYWWWLVAVLLIEIVLGVALAVFFAVGWRGLGYAVSVLTFFVALALIVPSLAVTWRRLHDTGRSGAWYFISFVPVVGGIILLVFTLLDSQPGPNQYGPNPKEAPGAAIA
jgi:uncharacterized membrane protein YhaH (DUF805 family)